MERTPLTLSPERLVTELSALASASDPAELVMAFDGDGTLWSGDVGEDLFHVALRTDYVLDDAREALLAEAKRFAIPLDGFEAAATANTIARALFDSYLAGRYPERETCAMMAWCYAGRTLREMDELSRAVLEEKGLTSRLTPELRTVIDWGRRSGIRMVLVSASPRCIVERAGEAWGFQPSDIAAATPAMNGERLRAELSSPVPYAENKLTAGRALFGHARWLASFGDNVFDIDMLRAAQIGVAVRPKPKLEPQLAALGLRLLAPDRASRAGVNGAD